MLGWLRYCLRSESYEPFHFLDVIVSITKTQTCLQALGLFSAYNALRQCTLFRSLRRNSYFESNIFQIVPILERGLRSNIAFIKRSKLKQQH